MMIKKEKTLKYGSRFEITIIVDGGYKVERLFNDGNVMEITDKNLSFHTTLIVSDNGKKLAETWAPRLHERGKSSLFNKIKTDNNYLTLIDNVVSIGREDYDAINQSIKELEDEIRADLESDSREVEAKKAQIQKALNLVKTVEETNVRTMPRKDIAKYLKEYNDCYNEGGEGWLPQIIASEDYEEAKKILKENENEIHTESFWTNHKI